MTDTKTVTITLNREAIARLGQILRGADWYAGAKALQHMNRTGALLDDAAFELGPLLDARTTPREVMEGWMSAPVALTLTDKQLDSAKTCTEFYITRAVLPNDKHTKLLRDQLGITAPVED